MKEYTSKEMIIDFLLVGAFVFTVCYAMWS